MLDAFRREIFETEKSRTDLLKWKMLLVAAIGSFGLGFSKDFTPLISRPLLLCLVPLVCAYVDSLCRHLQLRILTISEFYRHYRPEKYEAVICLSKYEEFCHEIRSAKPLEQLREELEQLKDNQTESSRTESSRTESSQTESSQTESSQTESSQTESSQTESSQTESKKRIDVFALEDFAMTSSTIVLSSLLVLIPFTLLLLQNYGLFFSIKIDLQQDTINCMLWLMFSGIIGLCSSCYINRQYKQKREVLEKMSEKFAKDNCNCHG